MTSPQPRVIAHERQPVADYKDMATQQASLARQATIDAFRLRTRIPTSGRTETVLAASESLTVRLKVYAAGGENVLHAHTGEDHVFIILQGRAEFSDAQGVLGEFGANEGVLVARGNYYHFHALGDEPLVMLRVGSPNESALGLDGRIDTRGASFDPAADAKNQSAPRFDENTYYG